MAELLKKLNFVEPTKQFTKNAGRFIRKCKKPSKMEYVALVKGHLMGLAFLGIFGYVIKVINIPINNIIAGTAAQQ
ncbi:protein transport protein SEC61 subunit gamma [Enteropsectra breve]|nr:protein transport protein SEC61 subunit gamma [Enteropsectra breve]